MNDEKKVPESFKTYEEGKHRRYTLLFAVNGGAFALAQFIADKDPSTASLGGLKLSYLCYGMALFTIVMSMDIFMFGEKMRRIYLPDTFGWQGKIVLILIGALICAGWILVAIK
jgi:hypothetical protein